MVANGASNGSGELLLCFLGCSGNFAAVEGFREDHGVNNVDLGAPVPRHGCQAQAHGGGKVDPGSKDGGRHGAPHVEVSSQVSERCGSGDSGAQVCPVVVSELFSGAGLGAEGEALLASNPGSYTVKVAEGGCICPLENLLTIFP